MPLSPEERLACFKNLGKNKTITTTADSIFAPLYNKSHTIHLDNYSIKCNKTLSNDNLVLQILNTEHLVLGETEIDLINTQNLIDFLEEVKLQQLGLKK